MSHKRQQLPELLTEREAIELMGGGGRLAGIRYQTLACGTFYLAADVREKAVGKLPGLRKLPELMGAKEAAACLGVQGPNLYKAVRGASVPQQKTARGTIYLADGIRALRERRAALPPLWTCPRHGNEDVRTGKGGKRFCAACNRDRKREMLKDSVRREAYNRRRRDQYQKGMR